MSKTANSTPEIQEEIKNSATVQSDAENNKTDLLTKIAHLYHNQFQFSESAKNFLASKGVNSEKIYKDYLIGYSDGNLASFFKDDAENLSYLKPNKNNIDTQNSP